jgi:queuine/archaeosine tRNA-ribosyltransferase
MEVLMAKTPITKRQKAKLKEHSVHHTPEHMKGMRKAMKKGSTFTKAHNVAKKAKTKQKKKKAKA